MRPSFDNAPQLRALYLIAGVISVVLSCWITWHQVIVNPDAICYLLSANEIGQSGLHSAMQLCGQAAWPFYSALIFFFSKYSLLSVTASAYLLDACFTLMTVLTFIAIVQMLGGTRRVLWLAAFVILSAHQFNSVRQYIVRDHGFWAFYLISILFMLRFLRDTSIKSALGFSASLLVAALFRIEGAVFLALLPFLVFFNQGDWRERSLAFLKLNILAGCAVGAVLLWVLLHPQAPQEKLGRAPELLNQALHGFAYVAERFQASKTDMMQHILPMEATRDAGMMWAIALVVLFFINIINNLSWVATALIIYAWLSGVAAKFSRAGKLVLWGYLLVNVIICAVFFAQRLFFSKRYLIAMSLVLLLWVPFALDKLLRERAGSRRRYAAYFAMAALFVSSLGVVADTGTSRNYLREAGSWLSVNIPADARLYSNDVQLAYYSQHYGREIYAAMRVNKDIDALLQNQLQHYDYVALRSGNHKDARVAMRMNDMHAQVVKDFANQFGNHVTIYKIPR